MKLQFDVAGLDLASVRSYSYKYFLDGNTVGSSLPVLSVEENQKHFTVTANVPPEAIDSPVMVNGVLVPPKTHTLELSVIDAAGESVKSTSFTVEAVGVLPAPVNLRLLGVVVPPPVLPSTTGVTANPAGTTSGAASTGPVAVK